LWDSTKVDSLTVSVDEIWQVVSPIDGRVPLAQDLTTLVRCHSLCYFVSIYQAQPISDKEFSLVSSFPEARRRS
jgi:hypothetical protein